MSDKQHAIDKMMPMAVNMWRMDLVSKRYEYCCHRLKVIQETLPTLIGTKGDVLLYGGGKKGEAGDLFNQVAEGLALLALLCPGGVPGGSDSSPSFGPYCFEDFADQRMKDAMDL